MEAISSSSACGIQDVQDATFSVVHGTGHIGLLPAPKTLDSFAASCSKAAVPDEVTGSLFVCRRRDTAHQTGTVAASFGLAWGSHLPNAHEVLDLLP